MGIAGSTPARVAKHQELHRRSHRGCTASVGVGALATLKKGGEKNMPSLDRFSQGFADPQEARVVGECLCCGGEVYEGEEVWETDEGYLHDEHDCIRGYIANFATEKVAG
jgi:hypothetical protein